MQGTRFLIKDANNFPINHGIILREITPTKYLCDFARVPTVMRICDISLLEKWSLFRDDESMNKYILALTPAPPVIPPKPDKKKKKVAKKKAKKVAKKKSTRGKPNAKK